MVTPIQLLLADDTLVTLNTDQWTYVEPEVKKTKSGKPDWYECKVHFRDQSFVTAKGRHDWLVRCLLGLEPAVWLKWWPVRP